MLYKFPLEITEELKYDEELMMKDIEIWKLLKNWKVEIINSFNKTNGHRISNGPMERVNRDITTLYRTSYGMRNFIRTRNRVMFCINQNSPILGVKKAFNNNKKLKKKINHYEL